VQNALGVNLNYTQDANDAIYYAFQQTGDFIFPNFIQDIEMLLDAGVRVSLYYGDADYICNWFGGQALSLAVNYTHAAQFAAAGYQPMTVNGVEYGEVRQYGNFSFLRVYESGHEVPYYQRKLLFCFQFMPCSVTLARDMRLTADGSCRVARALQPHHQPLEYRRRHRGGHRNSRIGRASVGDAYGVVCPAADFNDRVIGC